MGSTFLVNVIIFNPIFKKLVWQVAIFQEIITIITTQSKDELYYIKHLGDVFFSLVIEIFECLHQQANDVFINVLTWNGKSFH
jgi:hypothetical protein